MSSPAAAFRLATEHDLDAILRLYAQLHPEDPRPHLEAAVRVLGQILENDCLHVCLLELDGQVVATTYLNLIPNLTRGLAPYAVIENVVVDESVRGTGLGKQIMA